ncbi:MAG TPA: dinitrogenase iron-molybdenum cofactor biosynthesis protein [Firmicutes bacterium]|jgi:nitrogen fixation protein NifX|nr:dinitrogenase iron-molybdenum cofactor biosynthesis protein [Bacillota bacterium]
MSYRVAVASTDGKYVNEHFGRAQQFLIFELSENGHQFIELRKNQPSCHVEQSDESGHLQTVNLLADCKGVLVARIGPAAEQYLLEHGIKAFIIPDFIDEALQKVKNHLD